MKRALILAIFLLATAPAEAAPVATATVQAPAADFQRLSDRFLEEYFAHNPSSATWLGIHAYDHQLDDYSRAGVMASIRWYQDWLTRFQALQPGTLTPEQRADHELLLNQIQSSLLTLETIRPWENNPDYYSSGISASIFTLMTRRFALPQTRLQAVIARLQQMPAVFAQARANLKRPPKVFTEVAIEQLPGIISLFETDLPAAFAEVRDPQLLATFKSAREQVIAALKAYQQWLETELLPRSDGDFRLGKTIWLRKLRYDEMVDLPLERLLEIGYADLRRNQQAFAEAGRALDPTRSPVEILEQLNHDYPPPAQLLDNFRQVMDKIRDFMLREAIMSLPATESPRVTETPPFMRALTFASMDTPGPFETRGSESYFNVTLPEASWSASEIAEHMAGFNYGTIVSTAIHEAWPGHYIQFLWAPRVKSRVRQVFSVASNFEGWAHYCEQMMLEAGYGQNDPKLRLGQLQDALLRNARYIVGTRMHTGSMSYEEGVEFFMREGYQTRANAERETLRGTSDPTYLYYTLGKLQILKLREDYRRLKGADFSLRAFHDRFMLEGTVPIRLIRRALLKDDRTGLEHE
jgi:uncharacterized protein (DUF885 family)